MTFHCWFLTRGGGGGGGKFMQLAPGCFNKFCVVFFSLFTLKTLYKRLMFDVFEVRDV